MDSAPFGRRVLPQIYSRFIALLIHKFLFNLICRHCYGNRTRKGCAHDFPLSFPLSFLPSVCVCVLASSTHFHLLYISPRDRRLLEEDISRLSLTLNALLRRKRQLSWKTTLFYFFFFFALRSFKFTKWYFRELVFASRFFLFFIFFFHILFGTKCFNWKDEHLSVALAFLFLYIVFLR